MIIEQGTPVTVTAQLREPLVDADHEPLMLDSVLAWAVAQERGLPHLPAGQLPEDFPLPLARWTVDDHVWGWCCSQADFTVLRHTAGQIRRKPNVQAMGRYTRDSRHHLAMGPHKARDTTVEASWITAPNWTALTVDRGRLEDLLAAVHSLGKLRGHGYGRVAGWTVAPSTEIQGWTRRPLPDPGGTPRRIRPPYWHPEGKVPCSSIPQP